MKDTQKKIDKLTKSRLWPSILIFVLSLAVGGLLLSIVLGLYSSHVVELKFMQSLGEAQGIAQNVDKRLLEGERPDAVLHSVGSVLGEDTAIALIDEDGKIVSSLGDVTPDFEHGPIITTDDGQNAYLDGSQPIDETELQALLSKDNETALSRDASDFIEIVQSVQQGMDGGQAGLSDSKHARDTVAEYSYWQSEVLPGTGYTLFIKCLLVIREEDFAFGVGVVTVAGIMFVIIIVAQFANVIRQIRLRRRITGLLMTDTITGGDNWFAFEQKAIKTLDKKANAGKMFALVNLSIVKYQNFCSLHGTKAGEELLRQVNENLSSMLGPQELCGHVGGADFALFLVADSQLATLERVEGMLDSFAHASTIGPSGQNIPTIHEKVVFKAGVIFLDPDVTTRASRQRHIQIDLDDYYASAGIAKDSIPEEEGGVARFTNAMWEEQLWQHKVENSMQAALDNEEFAVYVQPKYNPNTNELEGAEALVRWISPTEGMIPPGRFIPIFERTGFITQLDDYMISHVAKLQSTWISQGKRVVPISVNVSRAHFAKPDLAEHICGLVDAHGLPHEYLEIELTESAFFDDKNALLDTVNKLKSYGFGVSMDDFGSGYSSLNSLKDLPLNVLKLDAGFFRGDDFGTRGEIVVSEAIALAKKLDMKIVAEGIEKQEQVDFLARQDCDMIQGYFYAKPMPASEYQDELG